MFYTFYQNNSGGSFAANRDLAEYVIIEADTASEANDKAESIGIYFCGVDTGVDCGCCGDRWHPVSGSDGKTSPTIYGKPPRFDVKGQAPDTRIHYIGGRKKNARSGR